MSNVSTAARPGLLKLTTSRVVTAAVLVALTIILGVVPGIGFIPLPNVSGNATIEHIPTILGSVLEGPVVGMVTGLTFGLLSFTRATLPLFKDPLVAVVPRILIGLTPWLVFIALRRIQLDFAAGVAGFVGSATNTFFVLFFAIWRGYIPLAVVPTIIPQAIGEAVLATILTIVIVRAVYVTRNRIIKATDSKDRSKMAY